LRRGFVSKKALSVTLLENEEALTPAGTDEMARSWRPSTSALASYGLMPSCPPQPRAPAHTRLREQETTTKEPSTSWLVEASRKRKGGFLAEFRGLCSRPAVERLVRTPPLCPSVPRGPDRLQETVLSPNLPPFAGGGGSPRPPYAIRSTRDDGSRRRTEQSATLASSATPIAVRAISNQ
jgi:hypothetical protein